jgi:hypothetical protein
MSAIPKIRTMIGVCHLCGDEETELIRIQHNNRVVCSSDGACRKCLFTLFCSNENKCPFDREEFGDWLSSALQFNVGDCPSSSTESDTVEDGYSHGIYNGRGPTNGLDRHEVDENGNLRFPVMEIEHKNDAIRLREIVDELTNNRSREQLSRSEDDRMRLIERRHILTDEAREIRERNDIRQYIRENITRLYNERLQQMIEEERELDESERDLIDSIEQLDILERERGQSRSSTGISRRRRRLEALLDALRRDREERRAREE